MNNKTLVIIPTYNEKENVAQVIQMVLAQAPTLDVLIVDDGSPDGTGDIVAALAQTNSRVHLLRRAGKQGLGRAYIAGFKWGLARDYAYFQEMDCDLSHDPKELPNFQKAIQEYDVVIGSRYKDGIRVVNWPLKRLILSKGAALYVRLVTGLPVADPTGGFKCFRREVLEAIDLDSVKSNGYAFQVELSYKAWMRGYRLVEIPITFADRLAGQSKMSGGIIREALVVVWLLAQAQGFRRSPRLREPAR